jgi:tetratricopeptide (TPR) repeat protein
MPFSVETFTITIDNLKNTSCDIGLLWGNSYVALPVSNNTDGSVMKQIDNIMNRDNKPYYGAAQYYYDNGKDLNQALVWATKAAEAAPKDQPWIHTLKTRILAKLGKKQEAIASAKSAMQIAKDTNNSEYVKQNEDILKSLGAM